MKEENILLNKQNIEDYFILNNYHKIPKLGLGTFNSKNLSTIAKESYKIGYRLFDTSSAYGTEKDLANGLWNGLFPVCKREDVYITTKLFLDHCFRKSEYTGLKKSLKQLRTSYIDNYLLHWAHTDVFIKNYKEMEKFYHDGLVRNIGVCNMDVPLLEKLLNECEVVPAINQIEVTPIFTQSEIQAYCQKHNILVMAYTPFARMHEKLFTNKKLIELSKKYDKKITQIILRWNIQQGRCVIPKTSNVSRLYDNANVYDFELSNEDLISIDEMNQNFRVRYAPDKYPIEWRKNNAKA